MNGATLSREREVVCSKVSMQKVPTELHVTFLLIPKCNIPFATVTKISAELLHKIQKRRTFLWV